LFIGTVTGADPDNDDLMFVLESADGGPFSMSVNGSLFVNTSLGGGLDFESKSSYTLVVSLAESQNRVVGSPLLSAVVGSVTLSVTVVDVNEAPRFLSVPAAFHIAEHAAALSVLDVVPASTALAVFDEDDVYDVSLVVTVGDEYFETVRLGVNDGLYGLRIRAGAPDIDYDQGVTVVVVVLVVTDSGGLSTNVTTSVSIDDVNDRT
jgi:hypothetical protein